MSSGSTTTVDRMSLTRLLMLYECFFMRVSLLFPRSFLTPYLPPVLVAALPFPPLCMCPPIYCSTVESPTMGAIPVVADTYYVAAVADRGRMCGRQLN